MSSSSPSFKPSRSIPSFDSSIISLTFPSNANSTIAVISLAAPHKLNSITRQDVLTLVDTLRWINDQPQITITVLTGKGRFFSAGADVKDPTRDPPKEVSAMKLDDPRRAGLMENHYRSRLATGNDALVDALINHRPLLVGAMNGPAVGICAAMLGHCDLLFSFSNFWLSTPFSSLGLVAEGLASMTFVRKLGLGLAQEALLSGRRISASELSSSYFVTRQFKDPINLSSSSSDKNYTAPILEEVLEHLKETYLPPNVDSWALLKTKELIRKATYEPVGLEKGNVEELKGALHVFMSGIPQKQFQSIADGTRRHKL